MSGSNASLLHCVVGADQDYEWYPTSQRMIDAVKYRIPEYAQSIMDIGAGDGFLSLDSAELDITCTDLGGFPHCPDPPYGTVHIEYRSRLP